MYLSGVPRRIDPVDFAADAVLGEGAGQEDGQVGGLKEGFLVVSCKVTLSMVCVGKK